MPVVGQRINAAERALQDWQGDREMDRESCQHGCEKPEQGAETAEAGHQQRLRHQREDAERRKAHDPQRDADHHIVQTLPEALQDFPRPPLLPRQEIAEQHANEDQRQELGVCRCRYDVVWHRPGNHLGQIAQAAAFNRIDYARSIWKGIAQRLGRLTPARPDQIDERQAGSHGDDSGEQIERDGLGAYPPERLLRGHVGNADDDGRHHQRHHHHLQCA